MNSITVNLGNATGTAGYTFMSGEPLVLASAEFSGASGDSFLSKCSIFRADEISHEYSTVRSGSEKARKSDSMIRTGSAEVSV